MIRLTLAQMRLALGRLVPAGLAIVLGTAFVAFTLIAGNVMTSSAYDQVTAQYASADLVVTPDPDAVLDDGALATARAAAGVRAVEPLMTSWVNLAHGSREAQQLFLPVAADPALTSLTVAAGRSPVGPHQVALPEQAAQRLGVGLGDTVDVRWMTRDSAEETSTRVGVVGLVEDPSSAWTMWGRAGLAPRDSLVAWSAGADPSYEALLVATSDRARAQAALAAGLAGDASVRTRDEVAAAQVASLTDGANLLVSVVLGFAAIALLVAALVIANTFQVLIAQRTRTLALLRCVGARRAQLRRSVLLEGGVLGLAASLLGVLVGVVVSQAVLAVLAAVEIGIPLPTTVPMTAWVVLAPLVVGTAVTLAASMIPARAATRVTPVEALRPVDGPSVRTRSGRVRLVLAAVLSAAGAALLAGATVASVGSHSYVHGELWLALGVLGAALSFLGILIGAALWMPRVIGGLGAMAGRLGPASQLAAANAQRNPRRTAATSAALLIGVTLVVTMSAGAATARHSLDALLDRQYPVDLVARSDDDRPGSGFSRDQLRAVSAVPGVARAVGVRTTTATGPDGRPLTVYGISAEQARDVLRDRAVVDALERGEAAVGSGDDVAGVVTLATDTGSVSLPAVADWDRSGSVLLPAAALDDLTDDVATGTIWVRLTASGADPATVLQDVQDALGPGRGLSVGSGAAERQQYEHMIDVMLAIVVGLLAVAVVIALIGVANTLSLSVLERRRESATLRSVGMTRRQLRGSLAVEGVLVAVVGTVTGIGLGLVYGWAGSAIVFGPTVGIQMSVPWADLVVVLVVAVAAGLLASVLPARAAARTSPIAALTVE